MVGGWKTPQICRMHDTVGAVSENSLFVALNLLSLDQLLNMLVIVLIRRVLVPCILEIWWSFLCFSFLSEKENLCLYGHPNENWEVTLPAEEVPPELPEPALGINFARDGMNRRDWLSLVAVHSDSWLLSVAFYFGARFSRNERFVVPPMELLLDNLFWWEILTWFYIGHWWTICMS